MVTWKIKTEAIVDLYKWLIEIANEHPDGTMPHGFPSAPFDLHLSWDDWSSWHKKSAPDMRRTIFFEGTNQSGRLERRDGFAEMSDLYRQLISYDSQDGALDGAIVLMPGELEISLSIETFLSGLFGTKTTFSDDSSAAASASVIERVPIEDGMWRYRLMSNAHVINHGDEIDIVLVEYDIPTDRSGIVPVEKVLGDDHSWDVGALTFITSDEYPIFSIGDPVLLKMGDTIYEVGNQSGGGLTFLPASVNDPSDYFYPMVPLIHYDSAGGKGTSGSILLNQFGEAVGLPATEDLETSSKVSMQYAVPIDLALESFRDIVATGKHTHGGYMEANYQFLHHRVLTSLGLSETTGYYVQEVYPNSRAAKSGLKAGDIILSYDGNPMPVEEDWPKFEYYISSRTPGETVRIEVLRFGNPTARVKIEYEVTAYSAPSVKKWKAPLSTRLSGIVVRNINDRIRDVIAATTEIDAASVTGVQIVDSEEVGYGRSNGENTGNIINKAVIIAINGKTVRDVSDFRRIVESLPREMPVKLTVIDGDYEGHIYPGRVSDILITDTKDRIKRSKPLDCEFVRLTGEEKHLFGINPEYTGFYVVNTDTRAPHPDQEPLFPGDIIVGIDKVPFTESHYNIPVPILGPFFGKRIPTFDELLGDGDTGDRHNLIVIRSGKLIDVNRLRDGDSEYPPDIAITDSPYSFEGWELNDERRRNLGLPRGTQGVYVSGIPCRAGDHPYGLIPGMVITSINGSLIYSAGALIEKIEALRQEKEPISIEVAGSYIWGYPGYRRLLSTFRHME